MSYAENKSETSENEAKGIGTNTPSDFILDNNGILTKIVRLKYSIGPTIVIPKKLRQIIIYDSYKGKGHQGIMRTVHMIRRYFVDQITPSCVTLNQYVQTMGSFYPTQS